MEGNLLGIEGMAPGPELAAALAGIDIGLVADEELVAVLQAEYRQCAYQRARLLAVVYESGRRSVGHAPASASAWEFADDEARAALGLTREAAGKMFDLAVDHEWRSPLGRTYIVPIRPLIENLPGPRAPADDPDPPPF